MENGYNPTADHPSDATVQQSYQDGYRRGWADAVSGIVHCKDCMHRIEGSKMCAHPKAIGWDAIEPDDDDFCSYGARKEAKP